MEQKRKKPRVSKELLIISHLIWLILFIRQCGGLGGEIPKDVKKAVADTLTTWRDSENKEIAQIRVIETDAKTLNRLNTQDSTIKWLKSVVKGLEGKVRTATVLQNSTVVKGENITIVQHDTIYKDNKVFVYPRYSTSWRNEWEIGEITASKDSILHDVRVINKFEISHVLSRNKWHKPREYKVRVRNLNPNTFTEELRAYAIKEKPQKFGLGFIGGYGINQNVNFSPFVGFGGFYRIL